MNNNQNLKSMLLTLKNIYEEQMPFNRFLEIHIDKLTAEEVLVRIDMRQELIGNFVRQILHGGVISSVLDLTGGIIASVELLKIIQEESTEEIINRMSRVGTIDLRVDYLRAGKGNFFKASGSILRKGNKVAVTRTELCNDSDLLIAAGTGTYLIG